MKVFKFFAAAVAVMAMVACTGNKKETAMTDREPANIMVVVDLQKDFIDGNLPSKPIIKMDDGTILPLRESPLKIEAIL
jgi:hypothetical protein